MMGWDIYQDSIVDKDTDHTHEEEIDISSDLDVDGQQPIIVEVTSDSHKLNQVNKRRNFPFPWTSEQLKAAFEKIEMEEECNELDNVVFFNEKLYTKAI